MKNLGLAGPNGPQRSIQSCVENAVQLRDAGKLSEAHSLLTNELLCNADGDARYQSELIEQTATVLRLMERNEEAVRHLYEARALVTGLDDAVADRGRIDSSLTFYLTHLGLYDQAAEHASGALDHAERMPPSAERLRSLSSVALLHIRLGHFDAARRIYFRILAEAKRTPDSRRERWRALMNLGVCAAEQALETHQSDSERRRLWRRQLRCTRVAAALTNLGSDEVAVHLNRVESLLALNCHEQVDSGLARVRDLLLRHPHREFAAIATSLAGQAALRRGQGEAAFALLSESVVELEEVHALESVPPLLDQLSEAAELIGRWQDAIAALRKAAHFRHRDSREKSDARLRILEVRHELRVATSLTAKERQRAATAEMTARELQVHADGLRLESQTDPLTGLGNRRALDETLDRLALGGSGEVSVVMVDLDHFKLINDNFSHQVGDDVLVAVAHILRSHSRPGDVIVRVGGEEIALIMEGLNPQAAYGAAERLRSAIAGHDWSTVASGLSVTASFGVVSSSKAFNPKDMLSRADARLYQAKATGRNRVVSGSKPARQS
jgi:two-component system, cell cycle response regulator